jgi:mannose-1-phosphate guanylyltransferase
MVLAAGLGTRLRPLTDHRAKCLVPVGDRPMLAHVVDRVAAAASVVVVNAYHRVDEVRAFAAERGEMRAEILLSVEAELLGTAGGVHHARALLGAGPLLVWNSDVLADVDPAALLVAHAASPDAEATLVVRFRPDGGGNVGLDAAGRVVRLRGEGVGGEVRSADFLAIHVIGEGLRARLPERGCLVGDLYIPAIRRGARIDAVAYAGPWADVGGVRAYLDANLAWLDAANRPAWVHPRAHVGDAVRVDRSVVGDGAVVEGAGALTRTVVWPGAVATAPLVDAVVVPGGIVVPA